MARTKKNSNGNSAATVSFEQKLWAAAEYKHVVLGLIFLKYISDAFEAIHPDLKADYVLANPPFNDSDRRDETLFIDARKLGRMVDLTHRELTKEDIQKIAGT